MGPTRGLLRAASRRCAGSLRANKVLCVDCCVCLYAQERLSTTLAPRVVFMPAPRMARGMWRCSAALALLLVALLPLAQARQARAHPCVCARCAGSGTGAESSAARRPAM